MKGGVDKLTYDFEKLRKKFINRKRGVDLKQFAKDENINYYYLKRVAEAEGWEEDKEFNESYKNLTDNQKNFCHLYVKYMNQTKAYKEAYPNASPDVANTEYLKLMRNPSVRNYIKSLQMELRDNLMFDTEAIIRKYIDIAFADMFDYIEVDGPNIRVKPEADGTLIQKIKPTPNGLQIDLVDKIDALKELSKRFGLDKSDFDKAMELKKLEIQERRIELQELKEKGDEQALEKLDAILSKIDKEAAR